jgi:hypothetical protein
MSADTIVNLVVNQKSSFQVGFYVKQSNGAIFNLTGHTVLAKYKENYQTPDTQALAFTAAVANAAAGEISIALSSTETANLQIGKYVYDVAIVNSSTQFKTRVVEGKMTVSGGVS